MFVLLKNLKKKFSPNNKFVQLYDGVHCCDDPDPEEGFQKGQQGEQTLNTDIHPFKVYPPNRYKNNKDNICLV